MKITHKYILAIIALSVLAIGITTIPSTVASEKPTTSENDSLPSREQLRNSFFSKRSILVVFGTKDTVLAKRYQTLLKELTHSTVPASWRNVSVGFKDARSVVERDLKDNIVFLVGTPEDNPHLKAYSRNIPVDFGKNSFRFNAKEYSSQNTLLSVASYPNPENDSIPMYMLTGNDKEVIFDFFSKKVREGSRSFFRQPMDYEIHEGSMRLVLGNFSPEWQIDPTTNFDFSSGNALLETSEHFDFVSHQNAISSTALLPLSKEIEKTRSKIVNFIGNPKNPPRFSYHVYKSAEEKGLMVGNMRQAHFDTLDNSVHTIINEKYEGNFIEKENALLIYRLLGHAKTKALELGFPVYFTDQWQRQGYAYWSARLFESGNALSLQELLHNDALDIESPLIADCMSATLVEFLLDSWGTDHFLKSYAAWMPTAEDLVKLQPAWEKHLLKNALGNPKKERPRTELPYLKGFNFAHEGYSIYNGYASSKATQAIEKMKSMGSNAMAIVPYSYIVDKNKPAPFRFSNNTGSENDEGVVHSSAEAKKLGMTNLLKPQVFAGNSWPGDVEMLNEEDWQSFFGYYHKWIRHYALLAEIHQMDALSVGVEFSKATLSHETEWRNLFRSLRGLYGGKLTYAANWGPEFEKVGFWDELDFIGLNCYYPLSKNENPSKAELKANFDSIKFKIAKVHAKFKKPIVFTEIGFRSINTPWKNPHAEGDDSFNPLHQQLCYEVVYEGIAKETWCSGILWWKFPSYLEHRGKENNDFTPNNKVAEETVKNWFSK